RLRGESDEAPSGPPVSLSAHILPTVPPRAASASRPEGRYGSPVRAIPEATWVMTRSTAGWCGAASTSLTQGIGRHSGGLLLLWRDLPGLLASGLRRRLPSFLSTRRGLWR